MTKNTSQRRLHKRILICAFAALLVTVVFLPSVAAASTELRVSPSGVSIDLPWLAIYWD